ncbi:ABC transporter permease [Mesorhizobium sp.]|uniref:ABC transporter permease n=1 Tax=Mesorhizobium sp. TaxID=1871066 RepID=UPI000FE5EAF4|nr:ABC transporter permease [Mesorhizobium sp.]RWF99148.1 MAG: ABC transporter permease [Mesorhizobium sp.]RWG94351.1 MAG: ABC transporter permease [Mesorhizobium sp.]TIR88125.1 MAG: ABC transporter permease [Mesorhizobium sp.]
MTATIATVNAAGLMRDAAEERRFFLSLALPSLVIVGIGAILPLFWILQQSLTTVRGDFSLVNYAALLTNGLTWRALLVTLELSGGTLLCCLLLGIPLAFLLASTSPKTASALMVLVLLPLWTSILVRTYGWLVLLRRDGLINDILVGSGLVAEPVPMVYNFTGTLIGMVHYMLPIFVLPTYAAMRDIDVNVIRAAASMGAGLWHCFRTVILPLSFGGIVSSSVIVFVYTLGFFITPAILGGGRVNPIAIRIDRTLSTLQDWGGAAALGILLLTIVAVIGVMALGAARLVKSKQAAD